MDAKPPPSPLWIPEAIPSHEVIASCPPPLRPFRFRDHRRRCGPARAKPCHTLSVVRYFNTKGPVVADDHYCIPPLDRVDLDEILRLIEWKKYFVLQAPRQAGKTSMLKALAERLNAGGKYRCLYINVESTQAVRDDIASAIAMVLDELSERATETFGDDSLQALRGEILAHRSPSMALNLLLTRWAASSPKPLVLLIDEIDTMIGDSLISVLRQLRSGYDLRPTHFPQSVILCGVRDVCDYRIFSTKDQNYTSGGSWFNIKAKSLRLDDFKKTEVRSLLAQHTEETGQEFEPSAVDRVWELTRGQPWLVNALALQACFKERSGLDRSRAISETAIDDAKETLILKPVTHLDQFASQLREDRVRRVIEPMLGDSDGIPDLREDDLGYLCDLGLIRNDGEWRIANPIYQEVIPRRLTYVAQRSIVRRGAWFVDSEGRLDLPKLMEDFQAFFREHSEAWGMRAAYKKASAQLLLHAFLQKVFNGGGRIECEYSMDRGRTDLLVMWSQGGEWGRGQVSRHVIECKAMLQNRSFDTIIQQGLRQTVEYMDRCAAESGHLLIFDQRPDKSWEERVFCREERIGETLVTVWGM